MKKIGTLFTLLCILNLFAIGGLAAYLVGTGRLDGNKANAIVDMLRHKGTPDRFREQLYDIMEPTTAPASEPSTQPTVALNDSDGSPASKIASAQDRIDYTRQAIEKERLRLENQAQELRNRQELLDHVQATVDAKLKQIEDDRKKFEQRVADVDAKTKTDSFQKSLALYNELKSDQVKDLFLSMNPEVVASFLQAMETDRAGKIIGEFQTPTERTFISNVLDLIRNNGTNSALGTKAPGDNSGASPGT